MKHRVAFIDLRNTIGTYINPIHRETMTGNKKIHELQKKLNSIIYRYARELAFADTCMHLWDELVMCIRSSFLNDSDREDKAYKEIRGKVIEIGNAIAFVSPRKGVDEITEDRYLSDFEKCNPDTVSGVACFLRFLTANPTPNQEELDKYNGYTDEELEQVVHNLWHMWFDPEDPGYIFSDKPKGPKYELSNPNENV